MLEYAMIVFMGLDDGDRYRVGVVPQEGASAQECAAGAREFNETQARPGEWAICVDEWQVEGAPFFVFEHVGQAQR